MLAGVHDNITFPDLCLKLKSLLLCAVQCHNLSALNCTIVTPPAFCQQAPTIPKMMKVMEQYKLELSVRRKKKLSRGFWKNHDCTLCNNPFPAYPKNSVMLYARRMGQYPPVTKILRKYFSALTWMSPEQQLSYRRFSVTHILSSGGTLREGIHWLLQCTWDLFKLEA